MAISHWNSTLTLFCLLHLLSSAFQVNAYHYWFLQAPGVAFDLTPDYGIAAIYLKDGTTVPIVRIQGPPEYQAFMRKNKTTSTIQEGSTLCHWLSPAMNVLPSALGLDVNLCRHPDVNSVKALLQTLKIVVESYLGTNFCYAALSFDHERFGNSWDQTTYEESVVQEALETLGVSKVFGFLQAAKDEILAREPRADDYDDVPGSSLHWFNVGMYIIDEGIVDPVDGTAGGPKIGMDNQLQALKDSLEHLFTEPPPEFTLPKDTDQLLVYGDDAQNDSLHHLLETFLGADLVRNANISTSVFDRVAFAAWGAHDYMNQAQFEEYIVRPRFGCMWRSNLYRRPGHSEL